MFLSTPPSRVATEVCPLRDEVIVVSIHATLAGGDRLQTTFSALQSWFLSTPPPRVATLV